jgi:putative ABC transport system permease protein
MNDPPPIRFHANVDDLHRLVQRVTFSDGSLFNVAVTPDQIGPALKNEYSGVVEFARFRLIGESLVSSGDKEFYEDGFAFADSSLFRMFSFPLIKGSQESILYERTKGR